MQQFLIVPKKGNPFTTKWCDAEKFPTCGGIAFDLINSEQTKDGANWRPIEEDHL